MPKHLFFICPTDHIESTINRSFKEENYFYTSLGNSVPFTQSLIGHLSEILEGKNIKKISFVLSDTNTVVSDAMKLKSASSLDGMKRFYSEVASENDITFELWRRCDSRNVILSNLLSRKMERFKSLMKNGSMERLEITGMIYCKGERKFKDIQSLPQMRNRYSLN